MSHIVQVKNVEITDGTALHAAVSRIEGATLIHGMESHNYSIFNTDVCGIGIQLDGWHYPIVIDLENGKLYYDNYGGSWGDQDKLDELAQMYSVEKTRLQAAQYGYMVQEEKLEDESLKLTLTAY